MILKGTYDFKGHDGGHHYLRGESIDDILADLSMPLAPYIISVNLR
ncbi:MAG: hypothetical protein GWO20_20410 [Candidatus Korarchaeota archaeon]|nr:hypothetical protein [Candidatus Korarchaeota archaeon]NIU85594.1 hypothetical protein [Candidatus Thorarchaeota archaeon]